MKMSLSEKEAANKVMTECNCDCHTRSVSSKYMQNCCKHIYKKLFDFSDETSKEGEKSQ